MVVSAQGEGDDGEDDEVGAASEVCQEAVRKPKSEFPEGGKMLCVRVPVSLSNLNEKAMEKKNSWYAIVMSRVMAR